MAHVGLGGELDPRFSWKPNKPETKPGASGNIFFPGKKKYLYAQKGCGNIFFQEIKKEAIPYWGARESIDLGIHLVWPYRYSFRWKFFCRMLSYPTLF